MVFHTLERFIGLETNITDIFTNKDKVVRLMACGFNEEEARNVLWLNNLRNKGKVYGTAAGIFSFVAMRTYMGRVANHFPFFKFRPGSANWINLAFSFTIYKAFDYFYTSPIRRTGESHFSRLYNNRDFLITKEKFIQTFKPLNRKFTPEEINFFYVKQYSNPLNRPRRWQYNPHIHGDEELFNKIIETAEGGHGVSELHDVQEHIGHDQPLKTLFGEPIRDKPYNLNNFIDRSGKRAGVRDLPLLRGW